MEPPPAAGSSNGILRRDSSAATRASSLSIGEALLHFLRGFDSGWRGLVSSTSRTTHQVLPDEHAPEEGEDPRIALSSSGRSSLRQLMISCSHTAQPNPLWNTHFQIQRRRHGEGAGLEEIRLRRAEQLQETRGASRRSRGRHCRAASASAQSRRARQNRCSSFASRRPSFVVSTLDLGFHDQNASPLRRISSGRDRSKTSRWCHVCSPTTHSAANAVGPASWPEASAPESSSSRSRTHE